ncbi:RNI-like protein [Obba rivulosa]|uniref:RNI-like protein n=1 Tax=Obba rivulosa TaxID=1052685 RepID=A0A8E2AS74_9APHY|nr:RNI-like protein [Obba rivulosa]
MSRRNNVRGPTSALTEFLRESGITPTTIARRATTQAQVQNQPDVGPSNTNADQDEVAEPSRMDEDAEDYASDNLDEHEEEQSAPKKRKLTKAAEAKLKAKEKQKAKRKVGADDDNDYEEEDPYNALSKMWKGDLPKPPVGSFEECVRCNKQFTVTKYTLPANPPPGYLCHMCAKASGADPFKKPAVPRKRKPATDKRSVVSFEERRFPSLASMCIQVISKYIDDVEALGDIGSINMDELAKSLARNRSLTPHNAQLFYDIRNTRLTMYDATNLDPPALSTLASLNPNLTHLRLDYCGRMDDEVIEAWSTSLPNLKRVELLGPFLVRAPAWQTFFKSHPALEGFLIVQSPRFDLECMRVLAESCTGLRELRLEEIGQMSDSFLEHVESLAGHLTHLALSRPGIPEALSDQALIDLMAAVGPSLTHLDLSGNINVTDAFLFRGLKLHTQRLSSLALKNTPELTDAGVAEFFDTWADAAQNAGYTSVPRLTSIDLSRNHLLSSDALTALLRHSGTSLTNININGWKAVSQESLKSIADFAPDLRKLDMSWCREADDWVVQALIEKCERIEEVKAWGCQRLTERCPRKRNVNIYGVEAQ